MTDEKMLNLGNNLSNMKRGDILNAKIEEDGENYFCVKVGESLYRIINLGYFDPNKSESWVLHDEEYLKDLFKEKIERFQFTIL